MNKTDLKQKTKEELLKLAQRLGLRGISTMNKPELVQTIRAAQARRAAAAKKKAATPVLKVTDAIKRRAVRKRSAEGAAVPAVKPTGPVLTTKRKTKPKLPSPVSGIDIGAHKFDVSPGKRAPKQVFSEESLGELPDSYGTGRLFLAARDPHWLFAYWDLTHRQLEDYRRQSSDGRIVLRLFERGHANPIQELTLHPDSRNWYIPVNKAATSYSADLGFWKHDGSFSNIGRSREATTPPDHVSSDTTARFATIPLDVKFEELLAIMRSYLQSGDELAESLHRMQTQGMAFPFKVEVSLGPWTESQAAQMERALGGDILKRTNIGSIELTEWLRRRLAEETETSSGMFSAFRPAGEGKPAVHSPGEPAAKTGRVGKKLKQPVSGQSPKAK